MYRRPCRTKFNPDYYSRDHIKQPYGRDYNAYYNADYNDEYTADYNTEYNAEFVKKLYYREYYPQWDPDSDSAIPSYTTTMTLDDYKSTSNQALPIAIPYEAV